MTEVIRTQFTLDESGSMYGDWPAFQLPLRCTFDLLRNNFDHCFHTCNRLNGQTYTAQKALLIDLIFRWRETPPTLSQRNLTKLSKYVSNQVPPHILSL